MGNFTQGANMATYGPFHAASISGQGWNVSGNAANVTLPDGEGITDALAIMFGPIELPAGAVVSRVLVSLTPAPQNQGHSLSTVAALGSTCDASDFGGGVQMENGDLSAALLLAGGVGVSLDVYATNGGLVVFDEISIAVETE